VCFLFLISTSSAAAHVTCSFRLPRRSGGVFGISCCYFNCGSVKFPAIIIRPNEPCILAHILSSQTRSVVCGHLVFEVRGPNEPEEGGGASRSTASRAATGAIPIFPRTYAQLSCCGTHLNLVRRQRWWQFQPPCPHAKLACLPGKAAYS
jgi:hypothetical protein